MSIHGSSESGLLLHGLKQFFVFESEKNYDLIYIKH